MEAQPAAIDSYAAGDPFRCAQLVVDKLPRIDQLSLLLLLSSLADLGMHDLLERIAPQIMESVSASTASDAELRTSIAVALGVERPRSDVAYYQERALPRLAFWVSRRVARDGDRAAADALLRFSGAHSEHLSAENYLSRALSNHRAPAPAPGEVELARLALQLTVKLRRDDLIDKVAASLIASGEPAAVFEGTVAQATLLAGRDQREDAVAAISSRRPLILHADPEPIAQAVWLLLTVPPPGRPSVASLVDELLGALAASSPGPAAARWAAVMLLGLQAVGEGPHWRRIIDFVIATNALVEADTEAFLLIAQAIVEHGERGDFEHLDAACARLELDDEARGRLVINGAVRLVNAGHGEEARELLHARLEQLQAGLDDKSASRDKLLLTLVRLAYQQGCLETAFAPLYELRYRAERVSELDAGTVVTVLSYLGEVFEVMGALGVAQRYEQEARLHPELGDILAAAPGVAENTLDTAAEPLADPPAAPSPLDPLLPLVQQHTHAQRVSDPAAILAATEQALAYVESSPLRGGPLHSAVQENLALELVAAGEYDRALDHWVAATGLAVRHIAGLAVAAPVEDLREVCVAWAHRGDLGLAIAERAGHECRQVGIKVLLGLRSLWADLRTLRRDAGADGSSPRRSDIAAGRRGVARLLLDGPIHDIAEGDAFFSALLDARRARDLDEIASVHQAATAAFIEERLRAAFDASVEALGSYEAFVGYLRVGVYDFTRTGNEFTKPIRERYIAVVLSRGVYTTVPIGDTQEIDALAEAFPADLRADALTQSSQPGLAFAETAARTLVDPLLDAVKGIEAVHVMCEGTLAELPWPLLWSQRGVEPHAVRIVQSFSRVGRVRAQMVRLTPNAVVVGRPDYGTPDPRVDYEGVRHFRDLPTAEIEATIVAQRCGGEAVTGPAADANSVLQAAPVGVLHVASHGFALRPAIDAELFEALVDNWGADMFAPREDFIPGPLDANRTRDPMLHSGIAMAGVNHWLANNGRAAADTGLITAEDLSWCELGDVDCVVLSACSSGVGKGNRALGSRGMRFAAIAAGADWTIASLWPVPDVATAVLMEWLYDALASGLAPPDALVHAQRRLRDAGVSAIMASATASGVIEAPDCVNARRYLRALARQASGAPFAHPYYWCGFVCSC